MSDVTSIPNQPALHRGLASSARGGASARSRRAVRRELPNQTPAAAGSSTNGSDCTTPIARIGTATTKPASGPAAATSKRARRSGMSPRMRMTAPKVPSGGTPGRKKGKVAGMP